MSEKFRRLRRDELEEVRDQFVKFLAVHGIDASTWQQMKVDEPGRADRVILQFSQTVFAGVIERVEYLLHRQKRQLRAYHCGPDKITVLGLVVEGTTDLDLRDTETDPATMWQQLQASGAGVKLFRGERTYKGERDQDIFTVMEEGARISDGHLYGVLDQLRSA